MAASKKELTTTALSTTAGDLSGIAQRDRIRNEHIGFQT